MVRTIKGLLLSRQSFIAVGIVVLATLVIVLGPTLSIGGTSPLAGMGSRVIVAALLPTAYLVNNMFKQRSQQMMNAKVSMALGQIGLGAGGPAPVNRSTAPDEDSGAGAQEVQALTRRFKDALATLKKRRFSSARGRRWLYQLPWYVIIGPPGSGKTTAIANSGLTFPLADKFGRAAIGGVGGTRNCDWWFTDDAVLIDTAGRYTTQDSDAQQDRAAWLGFLRLLKRYRRSQPLNGVFVAIGISELTSANDDARVDKAARIRERIGELYKELGVRLPVYMLFTKADLIAGFVEYFDDLGREGREAVWGLTFPLEHRSQGGQVGQYGPEFDALVGRLDERLLERIQQEGDIQRRALVFGFPQQVASLKDLTARFLLEAFEPNSFEEPILLRGVYFVSGTQMGTPLDRVMDAMSRTFGVTHRAQPPFTGNKRSYFLSRLLREVVFGEAWLVDSDVRIARQFRRLRLALLMAIAVVALGLSGFCLASYLSNEAMIARVNAASASYATKASGLKLDRVADGDLRAIAPLLDQLRDLETGYADNRNSQGWFGFLTFDQRAKLGTETRAAYRRALSAIFLPRLILRLEAELTAHRDDPTFLYPALEVYLMLGHQGPVSTDIVRRWMVLDWAAAYPDAADAPLRDSLAKHLNALLEAPFGNIGLDGALIDQARATLRKVPLAQRVLNAIVTSPEAQRLPVWRLTDNAGPAADTVLYLRSGAPLSSGIPGIYTRDGFLTVFLPMLPGVADRIVRQGWVLDPNQEASASDPAAGQAIQRDATGLYLQEFSLRWDRLISDVAVKPITTVDDSLRTLDVISAPTSPVRLLVASAAKETSLDPPPSLPPAAGKTAQGGVQPVATIPDDLSTLFKPSPTTNSPAGIAASYAAGHFRALHQLVQVPSNSGPDAQPPIDTAIGDLGTLYHSLTATMGDGEGPLQRTGQSAGAVARLRAGASALPDPIKGWILGVGQTSSELSVDDARDQLAALWSSGPGRLCTEVTKDRYPFFKDSDDDTPLVDFGRLFMIGGAIDAFFTQNLAPFVDMSQAAWRMRPAPVDDIKLDTNTLAQFQRAAAIRDSMFANGGNAPAISFELSVDTLDPTAESVVIDIDGQQLTYAHGAPISLRMHWPSPEATGSASVTFRSGSTGDASPTIATAGPWALFRLLDRGSVHRTGAPDRLQVEFTADGHVVEVGLRADSLLNPFDSDMLSHFHCPSDL